MWWLRRDKTAVPESLRYCLIKWDYGRFYVYVVERQNRCKGFKFSRSVRGVLKCVSPTEGLIQGQAIASAPLKAAIGFKQQPHSSPLPGSVIGFSGPGSQSNSKFLIWAGSVSRDVLSPTAIPKFFCFNWTYGKAFLGLQCFNQKNGLRNKVDPWLP